MALRTRQCKCRVHELHEWMERTKKETTVASFHPNMCRTWRTLWKPAPWQCSGRDSSREPPEHKSEKLPVKNNLFGSELISTLSYEQVPYSLMTNVHIKTVRNQLYHPLTSRNITRLIIVQLIRCPGFRFALIAHKQNTIHCRKYSTHTNTYVMAERPFHEG
jgi:hypothetical protein